MADEPRKKYAHKTRTKLTVIEASYVEQLTRVDTEKPRSLSDAYAIANPRAAKWKRQTLTNEASKIFNRPIVQKAIDEVKRKLEIERRRSVRSTKTSIENALWKEVDDADRSSDRIAALRTLASMVPDDLPEEAVVNAQSREELINRLEGVLERDLGNAIDVTPEADAPLLLADQEPEGAVNETMSEGSSSEVLDVEVSSTTFEPEVPDSPEY